MLEELLRDERRVIEAGAVAEERVPIDDLDLVPADTYELNRDVKLPDGTLQAPAWVCAAMTAQWIEGGLATCYAHSGDPAAYTQAFEEALLAAGYRITDRGRLLEVLRYIKLDHPDWAHTLTVFLGEYPEAQQASVAIVLFPAL